MLKYGLHLINRLDSLIAPQALSPDPNMVLKLVGVPYFAFTQLVAAVLLEKQVPFELVEVDYWAGEHKSESYLEKHPFGQIPYIDDDGFVLYESRAICRYIIEKYGDHGPKLIPTDIKGKALFEQAASIEVNNFFIYAHRAVVEMKYKPLLKLTPEPEVFKRNIDELDKNLEVYDKILSKNTYLAGDEITLADLFHLPYAYLLKDTGSEIMTSKPNVARWYNDIISRPSWQAVKDTVKGASV